MRFRFIRETPMPSWSGRGAGLTLFFPSLAALAPTTVCVVIKKIERQKQIKILSKTREKERI